MKRVYCGLLVCFGLIACAPTYQLTSQPLATASNSLPVQVSPVAKLQSPFQRLRFSVRIVNETKQDYFFSTESVKARLNGQPARVLSYEAQRQELESIILYYQPTVRFFPQSVITYSRAGQPMGVAYQPVGFDSQMDSIDLQLALDDLAYLNNHAVRPVTIQAGQTYQGEITLLNKLNESAEQRVDLQISFAGQTHAFVINARLLQQ